MNRCSEAASYAWSEPVAHWRMKVSICPSSLASVRSRRISGCRHRSSSKPRSRVHRLPVCAALLRILLLASVGEAGGLVPVSMICPPKVNRSTIAAQSRGSVKVFVQRENGSLEPIAIAERSSRSVNTWKSRAAPVAEEVAVEEAHFPVVGAGVLVPVAAQPLLPPHRPWHQCHPIPCDTRQSRWDVGHPAGRPRHPRGWSTAAAHGRAHRRHHGVHVVPPDRRSGRGGGRVGPRAR